ncbi:alcohol dehydrogenase catalytic domain-containing protein [Vreelandella lionensis]|uniref:alcohol dehydrogenase catalytic domain-containing protein n=1 Tax=Vreelandella lionensis TaxID=1144478 RepID=UPI0030F4AE51
MKAFAFTKSLPIDHPDALHAVELPLPTPEPHDIRVAVSAVSVNPGDAKVRKSALPDGGEPRVLGYDAVGVVDAVGSAVTRFQPGDRVWYAGSIARQGSNAEYQLVDERIASLAPKSLSDAQAAALPLTAITAWELLFDRLELGMRDTKGKTLLWEALRGVLARF